jgi:catechol 2,3-dioxygenase-like lactoylglutathione lyase family enzyme
VGLSLDRGPRRGGIRRRLALLACAAFATAPAARTAEPATAPDALLRSASMITRDLEASVRFYVHYLGYVELGRSEVTAPKSRQVVGAASDGTVRYVALAPPESRGSRDAVAGISFVEIPGAAPSPFALEPGRRSRAGELILAHRVRGIDEIARRMRADGVPIVAELGPSGSGRSRSMAVLDPNGVRVELYEY